MTESITTTLDAVYACFRATIRDWSIEGLTEHRAQLRVRDDVDRALARAIADTLKDRIA